MCYIKVVVFQCRGGPFPSFQARCDAAIARMQGTFDPILSTTGNLEIHQPPYIAYCHIQKLLPDGRVWAYMWSNLSWGVFPATCPENSTGTPPTCTCDTSFVPDPTATSCVPNTCPVPALTAPPFNDVCAETLENINSTQAQKGAACGALTPALLDGKACFEIKLSNISPSIPLKITSDIRDIAYHASQGYLGQDGKVGGIGE